MTLKTELDAVKAAFAEKAPLEVQATMANATKELTLSGIVEQAPKQGDKLISFSLPNQTGQEQTLEALLTKGPVVLTFYRGGWCPYCNVELQAYQSSLAAIQEAGGQLVAITPELPDQSLSTTEKNALTFTILSDINAEYARQLNLVFTLPEALRPIYTSFGIHVENHNGEGQFDLPLAATFVISDTMRR